MKRYIFILILCFSLCTFAQDFMPGTEDIPLMDNMVIEENETISFDTPDGQILNLTGHTKATPTQVRTFYNNTLKTLGWTSKTKDVYIRDKDELSLTVTTTGTKTRVVFQLTSANN